MKDVMLIIYLIIIIIFNLFYVLTLIKNKKDLERINELNERLKEYDD